MMAARARRIRHVPGTCRFFCALLLVVEDPPELPIAEGSNRFLDARQRIGVLDFTALEFLNKYGNDVARMLAGKAQPFRLALECGIARLKLRFLRPSFRFTTGRATRLRRGERLTIRWIFAGKLVHLGRYGLPTTARPDHNIGRLQQDIAPLCRTPADYRNLTEVQCVLEVAIPRVYRVLRDVPGGAWFHTNKQMCALCHGP